MSRTTIYTAIREGQRGMVRSKRNNKQRGGSNASDNVEALVAKTCSAYPEPIQHVIAGQDQVQNGVPYQIGAGRSRRGSRRASWFTSRFIPALTARIEAGDTPGALASYMVRTWNRRHRGARALTPQLALKMLDEFSRANVASYATSGKSSIVLPIEWFQPDNASVYTASGAPRSRRRRGGRQRGGSGAPSCPVTTSTLPLRAARRR